MLELIDSTGIVERASRLSLSSAFQLTQDADGLPLLDVNPGAFLTQAAADARYSLLGHTHTFASLTSKPTTIAGYGITDFNSLGDARWSALGHVHSGADITTGTVVDARLSANIPKLNISNTFAGSLTADAITLSAPTAFMVVLSGSPANVLQIKMGASSVFGAIGTEFSNGAAFWTYNATQNTYNADSWTQSLGSLASNMIEIDVNGLNVYTAIAGKAIGNKATFWGTKNAYIAAGGSIGGVGQLRMGVQGGTNGIAGDIISVRSTTTGAYYFGNSTEAYLYFDGTNLNLGAGLIGLVMGNFHTGIIGQYDATKYRMVYAMGASYVMPVGGTSLTGFYGISFVHDGTLSLTGHSLGHGIIAVANGVIGSMLGESGVWTAGEMWVGATRVAKVTWGATAPAGSAPIGTIYLQTS